MWLHSQNLHTMNGRKFEQADKNIDAQLQKVLTAVENATNEIKADFGL